MVTCTCQRCGKTFERYPSQVKQGGTFCSRECQKFKTGVYRKCEVCGTDFYMPKSRAAHDAGRFCSRKCKGRWMSDSGCFTGERNPSWKGGRFIEATNGYVYVRREGRYVGEHRIVMEQHLGRRLLSEEYVHHLNGDRTDNRIENLDVASVSEHFHKHWATSPYPRNTDLAQELREAREKVRALEDLLGRKPL